MINLGVIGCGYWGSNLIRNIHELPNLNLHTCCDQDSNLLNGVKRLYPYTNTCEDYHQILENANIQGVVVATPANRHFEIARKALESGKDIFVEKPLCLNSREASELHELAARKGAVLMVGHVFLYNPAVLKLRQHIQEGELGEVYYMYSSRVNLGRFRTDANAMWNLAPHDVSIMSFLLNEPVTAASARGVSFIKKGIHDVVFITLYFSNERMGEIHVSWLDPSKKRTMTVVGSKKMIVYDDVDNEAKLKVYDKGITMQDPYDSFGEFQFKLRSGDIHIPNVDMKEPIKLELQHLAECISQRKTPLTDGENGLHVVRVLEAAQKSLENNGERVMIQ